MAEQHESAGESRKNDVGAKQKKPTSAYRKLRRKFAKTRLRAPLVWLESPQLVSERCIRRFLSQVGDHMDTLRIVRNTLRFACGIQDD